MARWYGELTDGQGYAPNKAKKPVKRKQSGLDKLLNRRPKAPKEIPWAILTTRYGDHKRGPTPGDLSAALIEIYHEEFDSRTPDQQAEHPYARMRCGFKNGTMYILDVHRNGRVTLQQCADQDFKNQLAPETALENISKKKARRLWGWLMKGKIERLKTALKG